MATSISFTKTDGSGSTGALALPEYPGMTFEHLDQSIQQAMGGRITSITRGSGTIKRWVLAWENLPLANFTSIKTFFYTTVTGANTTVRYIDENGTTNTVKYLGGIESAQLIAYNLYQLELRLGAAS